MNALKEKLNWLLLGSGGREHALAIKLSQSKSCSRLFIAPGNAGTAGCGENVALDPLDFNALGSLIREKDIDIVVCGPEEPLVKGLGDFLAGDPLLASCLFPAPDAAGARLEGSKDFAKAFMMRHGIPTAPYKSFTRDTLQEAKDYLRHQVSPYVLKADGLAAGKGVLIESDYDSACRGLEQMLCGESFGQSAQRVVVESFLPGRELSVFVLTDGKDYIMLPAAKDYKRIGEDDTGLNTGGMGAVSPVPFAQKELMQKIESRIVRPTLSGLREEGMLYRGFLFFGLMEVKGNPYVIEYNVRLGDPETQVILPRIDTDMGLLLKAAATRGLKDQILKVNPHFAVGVVLASGGYPGEYLTGFEISHDDSLPGVQHFYAGAKREHDRLITAGGRVMTITAMAPGLSAAIQLASKAVRQTDFRGKYFRRDIGKDLLTVS